MITKILSKHKGFRDYWYPELKEKSIYINDQTRNKYSEGCKEKEAALLSKWKEFVPKGWYGFSLGPCPHSWYEIIDDFLIYFKGLQLANKISNFEIHQIKVKFGGIRFYISYDCDDDELNEFLRLQIEKLEYTLCDRKLLY